MEKKEEGNGSIFARQCVTLIYRAYIYLYIYIICSPIFFLSFGFYAVNVFKLYGRLRVTCFCLIKYRTWILQYNKLCSFYVSASLNPIILLIISRMYLIRGYHGRPGSSEVPRNPLTRWDVG